MVGQGELDRYINYFLGKKAYRGKTLKVSTTNQALVLKKFFNDVEGAVQTAPRTKAAYLYAIITVLEYKNKEFKSFTKEDMNFAFNKIYASKRFGPRRLRDIKAALTTFWNWLYKDDDDAKRGRHGHVIAVDWFKDNGKLEKKKIAEAKKKKRILSLEELKRLIDALPGLHEKTMVAVAYMSGCRPDEFDNLLVRDVKLTRDGAEIRLHGHKGERTVGLFGHIGAATYLRQYLETYHPEKDNPGAPLWFKFYMGTYSPYRNRILEHLLRKAQREAKIDGRINPYTLRHSRLTDLAGKITEQELKVFAGHTPDSPMVSIYVHLNEGHVKDKLRIVEGGQKEKPVEEKNPLVPTICSNCKKENSATNTHCYKCHQALRPLQDEKEQALIKATEQRMLDFFNKEFASKVPITDSQKENLLKEQDKKIALVYGQVKKMEQMLQRLEGMRTSERTGVKN